MIRDEIVLRVDVTIDADGLARRLVELLPRPKEHRPAPRLEVPDHVRYGVPFVPGFYP